VHPLLEIGRDRISAVEHPLLEIGRDRISAVEHPLTSSLKQLANASQSLP